MYKLLVNSSLCFNSSTSYNLVYYSYYSIVIIINIVSVSYSRDFYSLSSIIISLSSTNVSSSLFGLANINLIA